MGVFEERFFSVEDTISKAVSSAREWMFAQQKKDAEPRRAFTPLVHPIAEDMTICNSDAAWSLDTKNAGMGWVFSDQGHNYISEGHMAEPFVSSPLMAEALAIRAALNHAKELGISKICIKSDAQILIRAINSREQKKEIFGLLFDIHALAATFISIVFIFIPRSQNSLPDAIAKKSLRDFSPAPLM